MAYCTSMAVYLVLTAGISYVLGVAVGTWATYDYFKRAGK